MARNRRPSLSRPRWTSLDPRFGASPGARDRAGRGRSSRRPRRRRSASIGRRRRLSAVRIDGAAVAVEVDRPRSRAGPGRLADRARLVQRPDFGSGPASKTTRASAGSWSKAGGLAVGPKIGATTRSSLPSPSRSPQRSRWMLGDVGDRRERPGVVGRLALDRQQELAPRRLVHGELVGDGDLGLAVAVEVGRGAADDAGGLLRVGDDPLLPRRVLVPGAGRRRRAATTSGLPSPLTSATST